MEPATGTYRAIRPGLLQKEPALPGADTLSASTARKRTHRLTHYQEVEAFGLECRTEQKRTFGNGATDRPTRITNSLATLLTTATTIRTVHT